MPEERTFEFTAVPSGTRTANGAGDAKVNKFAKGVMLFLDITAKSGTTPTLDVKVQAKDPVGGDWIDIPGAAFAQKTDVGEDTLVLYPGVTEVANRQESHPLPRTWRVAWTVGGTSPSFTFSVGGVYLP